MRSKPILYYMEYLYTLFSTKWLNFIIILYPVHEIDKKISNEFNEKKKQIFFKC